MAEYQNIFTSVQAVGPIHHGIELPHGNAPRTGDEPLIVHLLGRIGNAQIGPVYLGSLGVASLMLRDAGVRHHRLQHAGLGGLEPDPVRSPVVLAGRWNLHLRRTDWPSRSR
ncbi:MAG: hypothetical protein V9G29_00985 [Burkholderiaceae bacterium]